MSQIYHEYSGSVYAGELYGDLSLEKPVLVSIQPPVPTAIGSIVIADQIPDVGTATSIFKPLMDTEKASFFSLDVEAAVDVLRSKSNQEWVYRRALVGFVALLEESDIRNMYEALIKRRKA